LYHFVLAVDTTDSTAADRVKVYVNGERITSWLDSTAPPLNRDTLMNVSGRTYMVGSTDGSSNYWNGYMAEVCLIDGLQLAPTSFGEFDEDSSIWKPIGVSGLTFGTNGYYLDFEDSSALGDDSAGSNNFSLTGIAATDQATDTCTNNWITTNPLDNFFPGYTLSEGNTKLTTGGNYSYPQATIYVDKGKWYWECKAVSKASGGDEYMIGIQGKSAIGTNSSAQANNGITVYGADGDTYGFGGGATTYAAAYTAGDIIGVALDCDNNKVYFSKGGQWSTGSGAWGSTTFNSSTGALTITAPSSVPQGGYSPVAGFYDSPVAVLSFNFGNPFFSISSGNSDGSGYGNFEYTVPSGYFSINSKNLAEYG